MEHIDVSNQSLTSQEAEIYRFVIRTTDLKDPVVKKRKRTALGLPAPPENSLLIFS